MRLDQVKCDSAGVTWIIKRTPSESDSWPMNVISDDEEIGFGGSSCCDVGIIAFGVCGGFEIT